MQPCLGDIAFGFGNIYFGGMLLRCRYRLFKSCGVQRNSPNEGRKAKNERGISHLKATPGRESGLFGTFFELVVGAGGRLFTDDGRPSIDSPAAVAAVQLLCRLAARARADVPDWHYDQVDAALLDGRVDAAGVWPGGWGRIRDSRAELQPHPYPAGEQRWVSYAGCHAWAIPRTCSNLPAATALVQLLVGHEANALDAQGGSVCAHVGAFAAVQPVNDTDRRRLAITAATIEQAMITYPPHPRFPDVEDAGWRAINAALLGRLSPAGAVAEMQRHAERILGAV